MWANEGRDRACISHKCHMKDGCYYGYCVQTRGIVNAVIKKGHRASSRDPFWPQRHAAEDTSTAPCPRMVADNHRCEEQASTFGTWAAHSALLLAALLPSRL